MNRANKSQEKQLTPLNRTQILKAVVADAESMGLRDRGKIEWLTSQVIERLEQRQQSQQPQPLPGMEDLVLRSQRQPRRSAQRGGSSDASQDKSPAHSWY